jgi:formate-dependent phosphoribosylglycinamide formyltransferase (GAR transformylase)
MPRNVVFFAPVPDEATMRFVRAVAKLKDVRLLGVVFKPPEGDDVALYDDLAFIDNPMSEQDVLSAVDLLRQRHGQPFRIVGTVEQTMVALARARERHKVPGTDVRTATLFREKALMKEALRAAGLPVARHRLISSASDARSFAEEIGFPMILKPPAGVGAKATFRVANLQELLEGVRSARPSDPVLAEEMLRGSEHSFETVTVGGEPRVWSFSTYLPGCLEVVENPWIQWACVLPREINTPVHERARKLGFDAIRALGLEDGMTHMEWFLRPDGSIAIGEIAARPPGPQLCQMTGLVHEIDPYRAWARAVIDGVLDAPWERRWAAGTAFVRGVGQGNVSSITGVRETHEAIGPWLVEAKLPTIGKKKNDSYEGDGYVVVRHQSTQKVNALISAVVQTLKIHYA